LLAPRRVEEALVERVLFALVANRVLAPCSKLAATRWIAGDVAIDGLDEVDREINEDTCYRAMDALLDVSMRALIRSACAEIRPKGVRSRRRELAAAGQLGVTADRRQRGAQLVAGVGDKPAQPRLALLPCGQRAADVVEHPVQRHAHLPDLGNWIGIGHPLDELHLAPVQRQRAHPGGRHGHPLQRSQLPAHQHRGGGPGDSQGGSGDDQLDRDEPGHRLLDAGLGQPDDHDLGARSVHGDQPVAR
jgi:hypothetical protein